MNELVSNERIWAALATIPDPEFGLSIVDLGLIYDVTTDDSHVAVKMTLTSQSCPAGSMMVGGVEAALAALPGIAAVRVDLVWDPAWTPDMLTPLARQHLGWPDQPPVTK